MPRVPGEPSLVEIDPRVLPTNAGEREKKGQKRKNSLKEEKEVSRVKSLLVSGCFLCTPVSWLDCT